MTEYIKLRNFHYAEYRKYKALVNEEKALKIQNIKEKNFRKSKRHILEKRVKEDCDFVYNLLKIENREIGTGELCIFLNERLDSSSYIKKYESTTFKIILGKYLQKDERITSYFGHVRGRRTLLFNRKENQLNLHLPI